jgi:hypothetical protein
LQVRVPVRVFAASTDQDERPHYTDEHGLACIGLRLSSDRQSALVEVWDENLALPAQSQPGLDDENGRGLMLIEAPAGRWGWDLAATGRGKIAGPSRGRPALGVGNALPGGSGVTSG